MVIKIIQTFESLNSDVRAKSYAQITFLGQDELGREKSDLNELSFWAHKPLRNGKKNMSGFRISQFWYPS